jgi:hypothetical protein
MLSRKIFRCEIINLLSVPDTDTGREVENTKGRERTLLKELGKLTL